MVECGGLENRCTCKRTEGSNPSLSASIVFMGIHVGLLIIINIHRVFPTPSDSWTVREKGKCYADWNSGKTKCY